MATMATAAAWLDNYVAAWKSYDPRAIGDLFSENAEYLYGPYGEPVRGREAIVANWLEYRDKPNTYEAHYSPVAVEGNVAVANGRSRYTHEDGSFRTEYDNIFVIHFDDEGRCTRFCEWFMEKPKED
jgi:hypothetical protein